LLVVTVRNPASQTRCRIPDDRYTLQIQLVEPDYTFLMILDDVALRAVAREVIEKYADAGGRVMDHPASTASRGCPKCSRSAMPSKNLTLL
jgi:hypothetical protein